MRIAAIAATRAAAMMRWFIDLSAVHCALGADRLCARVHPSSVGDHGAGALLELRHRSRSVSPKCSIPRERKACRIQMLGARSCLGRGDELGALNGALSFNRRGCQSRLHQRSSQRLWRATARSSQSASSMVVKRSHSQSAKAKF